MTAQPVTSVMVKDILTRKQPGNNMKRECPNERFANDFAERLKMFGYTGIKVVEKLGRWFVHYKKSKEDS